LALRGGTRFSVRFEDVFAGGCRVVPDSLTEAMDFDSNTKARTPSVDKVTNQRVWQIRVMDMDPDLAGRSREVTVKILADLRPVLPSSEPFAEIEFEGMTVTPYVNNTGRLTYSYRSTGLREPMTVAEAKSARAAGV
jgi:hypothetical protein